ncbi:MAG: hypothetical protein IJV69_07230 [Kiritimatiellae bacterium]|nr:hypothetical protein [Kiritimatiellia bacterium]
MAERRFGGFLPFGVGFGFVENFFWFWAFGVVFAAFLVSNMAFPGCLLLVHKVLSDKELG